MFIYTFFGTNMTIHSLANASYIITISRVNQLFLFIFKIDSQLLLNLEPLFIVDSIIISKDIPEYGLPSRNVHSFLLKNFLDLSGDF